VGVVRSLIALLILIASGEAQAQFPYGPHIFRAIHHMADRPRR
jgi:hypothetical protein